MPPPRLVLQSAAALLSIALYPALTAAQSAPYSLNLPAAFAPIKAKLAAHQQADILMLGDSLTYRTDGAGPEFSRMMRRQFGDAGTGWQPMSIWSGAELINYSLPYAQGRLNADVSPYQGVDGLWMTIAGPLPAGGRIRFTPHDASGSIIYLAGPTPFPASDPSGVSGEITARFPDGHTLRLSGEAPQTEVRAAPFALGSTSVSQSNAIDFFPRNNIPVTILGINNAIPNVPGVRVHRVANGGWGVRNYLRRDANFEPSIAALSPDLVFIWLGQNDGWFNRATYPPMLRELIARLRVAAPDVPIVLVGTYDSQSSLLPPLVHAMADVAQQDGLGFINLFRCAGPYDLFTSRGYLADAVHHNELGGRHIAELLLRAFMSDGASLGEPESCTARDFNHDGRVNEADLTDFQNRAVLNIPCSTGWCDTADFNRDGTTDTADYAAFAAYFLDGPCPICACDSLDFNFDGAVDPSDVDAYFAVLGESPCPAANCDDLDFNNDGAIDATDIDAYFSVLGEGPCL